MTNEAKPLLDALCAACRRDGDESSREIESQVREARAAVDAHIAGEIERLKKMNADNYASAVRNATLAEAYRAGYERYEYIRTLNVPQFAELFTRNLHGEGRFDDLVDAARFRAALAPQEQR